MKIYFLTFANTNYMSSSRICEQAREFGKFDFIVNKTEFDIMDFVKKHRDFIESNIYGYGLFIWKPKIIYDLLEQIEENDVIVYSDAGTYLNNNGLERFDYYVSQLKSDKSLCVFSTNDFYKSQFFVKSDAVMKYCPEFYTQLDNVCYAGLMIIRKSKISIQIVKEWLELCEDYHFLDKSPSINYQEKDFFIGNDYDNGLFNLVLFKFKSYIFRVYPDEINIYRNEYQINHTNINIQELDWTELSKNPFQLRRITPKFYSN